MENNIRVIEDKCNHNGQEVPCYVPQLKVGEKWVNAMAKGYVLKESGNPIAICKRCGGDGCKECNNRGMRKGTAVDLFSYAESIALNAYNEYREAKDIINKFEKDL